ncbi:MAG: hypothetical protein QM758_07185 [Armatimonas sp.]
MKQRWLRISGALTLIILSMVLGCGSGYPVLESGRTTATIFGDTEAQNITYSNKKTSLDRDSTSFSLQMDIGKKGTLYVAFPSGATSGSEYTVTDGKPTSGSAYISYRPDFDGAPDYTARHSGASATVRLDSFASKQIAVTFSGSLYNDSGELLQLSGSTSGQLNYDTLNGQGDEDQGGGNGGGGGGGGSTYAGQYATSVHYFISHIPAGASYRYPTTLGDSGSPPVLTSYIVCQSDALIATAMVLAWGAEAQSRVGNVATAQQYAAQMHSTLQQRDNLGCSSIAGSQPCNLAATVKCPTLP